MLFVGEISVADPDNIAGKDIGCWSDDSIGITMLQPVKSMYCFQFNNSLTFDNLIKIT